MARPRYLVVVAAGSGHRMGGDIPKQFLLLDGRVILQRTIEVFRQAVPGIKVVTVLAVEWWPYWRDLCAQHRFFYPQVFVGGGLTRFHSVQNALAQIPDEALVAIHDGVRPLLSQDLVRSLFDRAETADGVVPCLPVVDTLRCLQMQEGLGRSSGKTLPSRSEMYAVQTPQIFDAALLKAAYTLPFEPDFTDDASVVERFIRQQGLSKVIDYVPGERDNIKLTTPGDLRLAEAVLKTR